VGVLIKTRTQLLTETLDALRDNGILTNLSAARAGFILSQVHAAHLSELYTALEANTAQSYISSAAGPFLDLIGELFGIFRFPEQAALVLETERNIRFYVNTGTLAAVLSTKIIPVGTTVTTSDGTISYSVLEDFAFSDVATEVFVSAISDGTGPDQNTGKNTLTAHSLGVSAILVTNRDALESASDIETDAQLRARLSDAMLARATGNMAAIREAINIVPGVSEVQLEPHRNGPGTVHATVIPVTNAANPRLLTLVKQNLEQVRSAGTIIDVKGPRFVPVEITIILRFQTSVEESQKAEIRRQATQALLSYLSSLRIGQTFVVKEMIQQVMDVSEGILDFEIRSFAFNCRSQTLRNFVPDSDQLLVPDPNLDEPLRVL